MECQTDRGVTGNPERWKSVPVHSNPLCNIRIVLVGRENAGFRAAGGRKFQVADVATAAARVSRTACKRSRSPTLDKFRTARTPARQRWHDRNRELPQPCDKPQVSSCRLIVKHVGIRACHVHRTALAIAHSFRRKHRRLAPCRSLRWPCERHGASRRWATPASGVTSVPAGIASTTGPFLRQKVVFGTARVVILAASSCSAARRSIACGGRLNMDVFFNTQGGNSRCHGPAFR